MSKYKLDKSAQVVENQKKKEDFKTMYFNKCLDYEHLHEKFDDKCAEFELKEYDYKQTIFDKDQRIIELEEQLKNAIVPKFNRQEHIYCVAFGEIREFVVVAYLDNNITLCEDTTTSKLEWCDNKFLVLTKEEAETKLKELEKQECVK